MKHFLALLVFTLTAYAPVRADNKYVISQSTPSDCGPAALATLLHYYLDIPTTEAEMVKLTQSNYKIGTSFLKLEQAAKTKGCSADSFRMSYATLTEQLATYPGPLIVRVLLPEPHFYVLLHIKKDAVFVADPSAGNIIMRPETFLSRWYIPGQQEGFVFVIAAPDEHLNTARYKETIQGLEKQMSNLKKLPSQFNSQLTMFRR